MFKFIQRSYQKADVRAREELEQLSTQGWEIKAVTDSGEVIVVYMQKRGSGRV